MNGEWNIILSKTTDHLIKEFDLVNRVEFFYQTNVIINHCQLAMQVAKEIIDQFMNRLV